GVSLPKGTAQVQYLLSGQLSRAPEVSLSVKAAGFTAKGLKPSAATIGPDTFLTIPIRPNSTSTKVSKICLTPKDRAIRLVGTDEGRSTVVATTAIDGRPQPADISLTLIGDRVLTNRNAIVDFPPRIALLTGVSPGVVWLLTAATVLLLTFGTLGVLAAAAARDDRA
ncbi:MAG: hypothetical protein KGR19_05740, partial [Acidobacteria bacterium]|nr:hypothetical protein [Acidobacteriota bacterium]